jgi:hypothetical protein
MTTSGKKPRKKAGATSRHKRISNVKEFVTFGSGVEAWGFPTQVLKTWGITENDLNAIVAFQKLKGKAKAESARQIIRETVVTAAKKPDARFAACIAESESLLRGYATLDDAHRAEISRLIQQISAYLSDSTRKRPYNALMLASPGAGKSHFIKQLANTMTAQRVQAVTFNMATMQSADDMAQPIDELRNLKVNDRFPLLFLDEFDSDPSRYSSLLPLLWDGELQIGHRDLKLGKAVIVLAGSNPDLPKTMEQAATMRLDAGGTESAPPSKLVDLLSRINGGVLNIPDLDLRTEHRDRRVDKVCITVALLKARFGKDLKTVPRSLLSFISNTVFRYGVRSIAHLIDLIDTKAFGNGALNPEALGLPIASEDLLQDSSLKLHLLDKDQGFGIVNRWSEVFRDKEVLDLKPASLPFFLKAF